MPTDVPQSDALDRHIIHDAHVYLPEGASRVVVLEDKTGALTAWAMEHVAEHGEVVLRSRSLVEAKALREIVAKCGAGTTDSRAENVSVWIGDEERDLEALLVASTAPSGAPARPKVDKGPAVAIGRLPKALGALDDWIRACARAGVDSIILGGVTKHMSRSMNDVLAVGYESVHGLRGKGKFRCLQATSPRPEVEAHTGQCQRHDGVTLFGFGGVFSGAKPDRGGQALAVAAIDVISKATRPAEQDRTEPIAVVDLGCGNGTVSALLSKGFHGQRSDTVSQNQALQITATDVDLDAVRSARATLKGFENTAVTWDDAGSQVHAGSQDFVLLNPPFHDGTRIDSTLVEPLLDAAKRMLKPGGTLLFVHNSHLRYRPLLEARWDSVNQVSRDKTFTVLSAQDVACDRERAGTLGWSNGAV